MRLFQAFNRVYKKLLTIQFQSFPDQLGLQAELANVDAQMNENEFTNAISTQFAADTKDFVNHVYMKDEAMLSACPLMQRINMADMWASMVQEERDVFWDNMTSLMRYHSMLEACGTELGSMESMATEFMQRNQGLKPEEYHAKLFQEMLSGGDMSQRLMGIFQNPNTLKNMLKNVGNIMRSSGEEKSLDLEGLSEWMNVNDLSNIDADLSRLSEVARESGLLDGAMNQGDMMSAARQSLMAANRAAMELQSKSEEDPASTVSEPAVPTGNVTAPESAPLDADPSEG